MTGFFHRQILTIGITIYLLELYMHILSEADNSAVSYYVKKTNIIHAFSLYPPCSFPTSLLFPLPLIFPSKSWKFFKELHYCNYKWKWTCSQMCCIRDSNLLYIKKYRNKIKRTKIDMLLSTKDEQIIFHLTLLICSISKLRIT